MNRKQREYLRQCVRPQIRNKSFVDNFVFSYLAKSFSMQEIAWSYRIDHSTVHKIIKETYKVFFQFDNRTCTLETSF